MILEKYKPGQFIAGQELVMLVEWFGKQYYLLKDGDGVIYGTKVDEDGNPSFL